MKLRTLFEACITICDKHIDKNPNACIKMKDTTIRYTDLKDEISKTKDWCYKDLDTNSFKQVIECKDCKHYTSCTKVVSKKAQTMHICELDKGIKSPDHYCGYAVSRKDVEM